MKQVFLHLGDDFLGLHASPEQFAHPGDVIGGPAVGPRPVIVPGDHLSMPLMDVCRSHGILVRR